MKGEAKRFIYKADGFDRHEGILEYVEWLEKPYNAVDGAFGVAIICSGR